MRVGESRILVLDGDCGAALSVVRSLARRGLVVDVADCKERFLAALSRHRDRVLRYPDPRVEPDAFALWVRDRVCGGEYDFVVPVTDDTVQPLARIRGEIEPHAALAIADDAALEVMTDKEKTFALAAELGVPLPRGETCATVEELMAAAAGFGYPLVIKPTRSVSAAEGDVRVSLTVRYATGPEEVTAVARDALRCGPVIVQEYFRGRGVGVEVLCDRGEVVYAFQHERLHELPLTGGGSSLRKSVPVDAELLEHSRRLLGAVGWHGAAMVEFKVDGDRGRAALMEVNGRFWGSLPLAVAAGADFPAFLYDLLVLGERPSAPPARVGIVGRRLWFDTFWYLEVFRRADPNPLIVWPGRWQAFRDLLLVFTPRHRFDVQTWSDPVPGLVDAAHIVRDVFDRVWEKIARRRVLARMRRVRRNAMPLRGRIHGASSILFLCYGNINRSVLAERHLRQLLGATDDLVIRSAGFHPRSGRAADPVMRELAADRGVSLADAQSRRVDGEMIEAADLVFVMDAAQVIRVGREYPEAKDKTLLLGAVLADDAPLEIGDPYGADRPVYAACLDTVTACTSAIADATRRRRVDGDGAREAAASC